MNRAIQITILACILAVAGAAMFIYQKTAPDRTAIPLSVDSRQLISLQPDLSKPQAQQAATALPVADMRQVSYNVPFAAQASLGDWNDPRQQDGCEEESAIMAMHWVEQKPMTKEDALQEIIAISDYEQRAYGDFHNTSAKDTVDRIFGGYYGYKKASYAYDISIADIVRELDGGNLVIVPVNGQALGNTNYTAPGPARHMILIKGYDPKKNEFITNDPGTRRGDSYRYGAKTLFDAIRDYPTGPDAPFTGGRRAMIFVAR
jgi:hypothetical protein